LTKSTLNGTSKQRKAASLVALLTIVILGGGIWLLLKALDVLNPVLGEGSTTTQAQVVSTSTEAASKNRDRSSKNLKTKDKDLHPFSKIIVSGRVFDHETSRGIHGALVTIKPLAGAYVLKPNDNSGKLVVTTGPAGYYYAEGIPPGAFEFLAEASGYMPTRQRIRKLSVIEDDEGIDLALKKAIVIEGRVINQSNAPVSQATVVVQMFGQGVRVSARQASAETNEEGYFLIDPAPSNTSALYVAHPDYAAKMVRVKHSKEPVRKVEIQLDGGMIIQGTVRSETGPIEGAFVSFQFLRLDGLSVFLSEMSSKGGARTGAAGQYKLTAPLSRKQGLLVTADGFLSETKNVTLTAENLETAKNVDFQLSPSLAAHGQVLLATGKPAVDAEIAMVPKLEPKTTSKGRRGRRPRKRPSNENGAPKVAACDKEGRFKIAGLLPSSSYEVFVRASGYPSLQETVNRIDRPLLFTLSAGAKVSGVVVNQETQEPVTRFRYFVSGACGSRRNVNITGASGGFEIDGLNSGNCALGFRAPGYVGIRLLPFELVENENKVGVQVALPPGATLAGKIVGTDTKGARFVFAKRLPDENSERFIAGNISAPINSDGSFIIEDLAPGRYQLRTNRDKEPNPNVVSIGLGEVREGIEL